MAHGLALGVAYGQTASEGAVSGRTLAAASAPGRLPCAAASCKPPAASAIGERQHGAVGT